jgi:hypothetical protein
VAEKVFLYSVRATDAERVRFQEKIIFTIYNIFNYVTLKNKKELKYHLKR